MSLTAFSRGKKTTITMKISIKLAFAIIFYFSFCISSSLPQDVCPTYVDIPGSQPRYPVMGAPSSDCRSVCLNTTDCRGSTQQSGSSSCLLNRGNENDINYNATAAVTYSVILRTSCNTGQICSWVARPFTYGSGGARNSMTKINDCLMSCQTDSTCIGLDWDSNQNSCWLFTRPGYPIADSGVIHHFYKNCSTTSTISTTTGSTSTTRTTLVVPSSTSSGTTRTSVAVSSTLSSTRASGVTQPTPAPSLPTAAPSCKTPCSTGSVCHPSGVCVCNTVCSLEEAPVCGTDGVTYGNECLFNMVKCQLASNTTIRTRNACGAVDNYNPMAIKPAYIVLAGVGGGCLLLVLTAVIILCEYSMNDETFTHGVVKQPKQSAIAKQQQVHQVEQIDIAVVEGENVEFNPYYNRSEIDAPDFTKEENLM